MSEQLPQPPPKVLCPKCGSDEHYAAKKGFSGKKAVAGAILTGGIGLLAGTLGSNKIKITCLNCGHIFYPGDAALHQSKKDGLIKEKEDFEKSKESIKIIKEFFSAYKFGDKEAAFEQLKQRDPSTAKYSNADEAYKKLKTAMLATNIGCTLLIITGLTILILVSRTC
jgi:hypothetical protein